MIWVRSRTTATTRSTSLLTILTSPLCQAVVGQCAVFSCFAVTQFLLLLFDRGPAYYVYGELSYLILSLVAKGMLGLVLIANVFILESIDEASYRIHPLEPAWYSSLPSLLRLFLGGQEFAVNLS